MQITQTLNDIISIVFEPVNNPLYLLDFVLVEEENEKFLAQIIEIKNDKFDSSKNLATIKIFYSVNENNEIVEYNGYTPTKMCKITICNQREIEDFVNAGKKTLPLTVNPKTMLPLNISQDFLDNNAIILADKIDDLNVLYANILPSISAMRHVVVFDYTGSLNIKNSTRLRASVDFHLPLDFYSLDYIWNNAMSRASLETQAVVEDIFNEVKEYSKTLKDNFIPFNNFLRVIHNQYKETPIRELHVLRNRLIKYQQLNLFAKTLKDFNIVNKTIEEENVTIIDFSKLDADWQKEYTDFLIRVISSKCYLFLRLNDKTTDHDLISKMYSNSTKAKIIPSASYGFKKLSYVLEYLSNYIFLPTLNPTRNYGEVNASIWTLTQNYALLFGRDTKNFIFKIQNMLQPKKKANAKVEYHKIDFKSLDRIKSEALEVTSSDKKGIITPNSNELDELSLSETITEFDDDKFEKMLESNANDNSLADIQKEFEDDSNVASKNAENEELKKQLEADRKSLDDEKRSLDDEKKNFNDEKRIFETEKQKMALEIEHLKSGLADFEMKRAELEKEKSELKRQKSELEKINIENEAKTKVIGKYDDELRIRLQQDLQKKLKEEKKRQEAELKRKQQAEILRLQREEEKKKNDQEEQLRIQKEKFEHEKQIQIQKNDFEKEILVYNNVDDELERERIEEEERLRKKAEEKLKAKMLAVKNEQKIADEIKNSEMAIIERERIEEEERLRKKAEEKLNLQAKNNDLKRIIEEQPVNIDEKTEKEAKLKLQQKLEIAKENAINSTSKNDEISEIDLDNIDNFNLNNDDSDDSFEFNLNEDETDDYVLLKEEEKVNIENAFDDFVNGVEDKVIEENKKQKESENKDDIVIEQIESSNDDGTFEIKLEESNYTKPEKTESEDFEFVNDDKIEIKEEIPIYFDGEPKPSNNDYKIGDIVFHENYGEGRITKTVNFANRNLLQIEFDNMGKRLLDPTLTRIVKK